MMRGAWWALGRRARVRPARRSASHLCGGRAVQVARHVSYEHALEHVYYAIVLHTHRRRNVRGVAPRPLLICGRMRRRREPRLVAQREELEHHVCREHASRVGVRGVRSGGGDRAGRRGARTGHWNVGELLAHPRRERELRICRPRAERRRIVLRLEKCRSVDTLDLIPVE